MRAIHLTSFGNPQGLEYVQIQEPPAPGPGQVLIGVEFSPINLNGLSVVRGIYPSRPSLPSVIGNEGVGRIPIPYRPSKTPWPKCNVAARCCSTWPSAERARARVEISTPPMTRRCASRLPNSFRPGE